jgi:hypothetical protein
MSNNIDIQLNKIIINQSNKHGRFKLKDIKIDTNEIEDHIPEKVKFDLSKNVIIYYEKWIKKTY